MAGSLKRMGGVLVAAVGGLLLLLGIFGLANSVVKGFNGPAVVVALIGSGLLVLGVKSVVSGERALRLANTSNVPAEAAGKSSAVGVGCGVVILAIVALVLGRAFFSTPEPKDSPRNAYLVCWQFVRDRLKAPATAKFPASNDPAVVARKLDNGAYRVTAYVDSQNGFGALVRTPFVCNVTWQGDSWHLNDLNLVER